MSVDGSSSRLENKEELLNRACERWELRERKSPQCSRPFLFPE